MKKIIVLIVVLIGQICYGKTPLQAVQHKKTSPGIVPLSKNVPVTPGLLIVKQRPGLPKIGSGTWQRTLQKINAQSFSPVFPNHEKRGTNLGSIYQVRIPGSADVYLTAEQLMQDPLIEWAEPLYIRHLTYSPNDPSVSFQWHIPLIHCPAAWDLIKGDTTIVIGIVDTGAELDHPDLHDNLWRNPHEIPGDGRDNDGNGYIDDIYGWDFGDGDNDPSASKSVISSDRFHGTSVAGTACAVTDNGIGVAAPAFNARIMVIKATQDNDEEQNVFSGYRGIAYAADNGADIVNCSFGGEGASNVEREVIAHACSLGVVIVAAAGNANQLGSDYPAAYPNVLSVAATEQYDKRAYFSNYGPDIDLSAPGYNIYTTDGNQSYTVISGTSFSSPIVAGVAALVKGFHPDWTGEQVREQVRVSALPIDNLNPGYEGNLGWGRVDAYRALTVVSPAIRILSTEVTEGSNSNSDGIVGPGETAELSFTIENYLSPSDPISLHFSTSQIDATLENPFFNFPGLGMLASVSNTTPLKIHVAPNAQRGQVIVINVEIDAGSYHDKDQFSFEIAPDYKMIQGKNVSLTLTSIGRLGFADYPDNSKGIGFLFQETNNLLFEGAFMAATSVDSVSDAARGADQEIANHDFDATPDGDVSISQPDNFADMEGISKYSDSGAAKAIGIQITQTAYAFNKEMDGYYILLSYQITPSSSHPVPDLYAGLFMDWDVGDDGLNSGTNKPGFDPNFNLAYVFDPATNLYGGLRIFPDTNRVQYHSINNSDEIYDGYTDWEKWGHLSNGIQPIYKSDPGDYSHVLGAGPFSLSLNDTVTLGYAIIAANGLNNLKSYASSALNQWQTLVSLDTVHVPGGEPDSNFVLYPCIPNPFIDETIIRFQVPETGHVSVIIYNILGQEVIRLMDEEITVNSANQSQPAFVIWDRHTQSGRLAVGGIYIVCLQYLTYRKVQKVILIGSP